MREIFHGKTLIIESCFFIKNIIIKCPVEILLISFLIILGVNLNPIK